MIGHISIVLVLCQLILSQFVKPPTSFITKRGYANVTIRYKEVPPGICELKEGTKSYSGYADVAKDQHVFWWFFEARDVDPVTAPLTVFLQGGPGASSMLAIFQEMGPCRINSSYMPENNPYSWTSTSNMLFIDQPILAGFSYSTPIPAYKEPKTGDLISLPNNECPGIARDWNCGTYARPDPLVTANSTPRAAPNVYLAIQGFMGAFPQYNNGDFILASESYGGFYGPMFSKYFLDQDNIKTPGTVPINQKALLVGNGWFDALAQYEAYYTFTVNPGNTYDLIPYNTTTEKLLYNQLYGKGNCLDQIRNCASTPRDDVCTLADQFCESHVESLFSQVTGRDVYDVRYLTPNPFPPTYFVDYLNIAHVQEAIGAYVNFTRASRTVSRLFQSTGDRVHSPGILSNIKTLIQNNITVALYFGDADYICNHLALRTLHPLHPPQSGYTLLQTHTSTPTHPRGSVRQSTHFATIRVYDSGHLVPFYQPELAQTMFNRIISRLDIATGTTSVEGALTKGPEEDGWRQGNGSVLWEVVPRGARYDWVRGVPVLPEEEEGEEMGGSEVGNGRQQEQQEQQQVVLGRERKIKNWETKGLDEKGVFR